MHRKILLLLLVILLIAPRAGAQGELEVTLAQVDTSRYPEVTLYVNVTDAAGEAVVKLAQEEFMVTEDGQPVTLTAFAGVGAARPADIVFVFDTTGSMEDEINGVKETCVQFAERLEREGRDYRLGLVTFWDDVRGVYGDGDVLTADVHKFKKWIGDIRIVSGSGDDKPENDFGALKRAAQMKFRDAAQRIFILITDAPPHEYGDSPDSGVRFDDPDLTADRISKILTENTITVYAVAYDHRDFRQIVRETNGRFYDIQDEPDFTGLIDEIGGLIATQYKLTYQTPRGAYDGTKRDIRVAVSEDGASGAGGEATSTYLEKHLINLRSGWLVALIFLVPLLTALLLPLIFRRRKARQIYVAPTADMMPPQNQAEMHMAGFQCPRCGNQLRPGAAFCGSCGLALKPRPAVCPHCGAELIRPESKFCGKCGGKIQ